MQLVLCCGTRALKQRVEEEAGKKDSLLSAASSAELGQEAAHVPVSSQTRAVPASSLVMQLPGVSEGVLGKQLPLSGCSCQLYLPGQPQELEPEILRTPGLFCLPGSELGSHLK